MKVCRRVSCGRRESLGPSRSWPSLLHVHRSLQPSPFVRLNLWSLLGFKMAELSVQRSASQSSIPVVTPRPSRSSISSTFPLSQTSLVSQLRRKSESTNQHTPAPTSVPSAVPQTPIQSSIPSFRSIRNLLPFAPAKTNTPTVIAHTSKPSIVNFGSLRRIGNERKNSATHSHPQEAEQTPVIAIARPSENFEEEMMARKRSRDGNRSDSDTSPSSLASEEHYGMHS